MALFDRSGDYAKLLAAIGLADGKDAKIVRGLRREFAALSAIDFFPGEARRQTGEALTAIPATYRDIFAGSPPPTTAGGRGRRAATCGWIAWPARG